MALSVMIEVPPLSPRSIGPRCGDIPSPLARLVTAAGIFPLPSLDWSLLRGYSLSAERETYAGRRSAVRGGDGGRHRGRQP
eukprot:7629117-Pyramimonas_sp.AAC.1